MSKWKRMCAGLFVSCAFGAILLGMARATPPKGIISNILEGPFAFDEIDIRARTPSHGRPQWKARIITQGLSDGYFQRVKIAPGGESGWHSHPGLVFASVVSGELTVYDGEDLDAPPQVIRAGTGFTESPGHVHLARNNGRTDVEVVVFYLLPKGAKPRTDEPAPSKDDDD